MEEMDEEPTLLKFPLGAVAQQHRPVAAAADGRVPRGGWDHAVLVALEQTAGGPEE